MLSPALPTTENSTFKANRYPKAITQVSDELKSIYAAYRKLHEDVFGIQQEIVDAENVYLEETPYGNIVRGWDGNIDNKVLRKEMGTMKYKTKSYSDQDYLFSNSSAYESLGREPDWSLVDPSNVDTTMAAKSARLSMYHAKTRANLEKNTAGPDSPQGASLSNGSRRKSSMPSVCIDGGISTESNSPYSTANENFSTGNISDRLGSHSSSNHNTESLAVVLAAKKRKREKELVTSESKKFCPGILSSLAKSGIEVAEDEVVGAYQNGQGAQKS